jgi:hypothetical protein
MQKNSKTIGAYRESTELFLFLRPLKYYSSRDTVPLMFVECCRCAAAKEQRDHMRAMGHPIPDSEDSDAEDDSVGHTLIFIDLFVPSNC